MLVVGLTPRLLCEHTPNLNRLAQRGGLRSLDTIFPAVTCSVQSTLLTGTMPADHGVVGNGWYFRDLSEVLLWRQSNSLVKGEKIWDSARCFNPDFTCAQMFWWYNMYSSADFCVTPRPMYPADGRKIPDHYTYPPELHDELDAKLGVFPLFNFWGPMADISSSQWIADATEHVMLTRKPTLTLCYLPHLDYNLQRLGPNLGNPRLCNDLKEIDSICGQLISAAESKGSDIMVVSEYGITAVKDAIHINRILRQQGLIAVRRELGLELLDAGASDAFAVADHQIAHIYIRNQQRIQEVRTLLESVDGIEAVLDEEGKQALGLNHANSGELIAISSTDRWFSYYYWLDDAYAPDFARTVDIHRKPGYDPVELFLDPDLRFPAWSIGWRLLKKRLGFCNLMDVISLKDTQLVRGSHGRITDSREDAPLVISSRPELLPEESIKATDFKQLTLAHIFNQA